MKMPNPFLFKISLCVIVILFAYGRLANAQEVAPQEAMPEEAISHELTPDEEIPWEVAPEKVVPENVLSAVVPENVPVAEEYTVPKEHEMAVMLVAGTSGDTQNSSSGFACRYKDREFIATNLHVIEGVSAIKVTSLTGKTIGLSDQMIVSEDSDICFIGIKGNFADLGIVPFEFMEDVVKESKSGDDVICLGNGPDKGVITATKGKIESVGELLVEIDVPAAGGNSGGPVIHRDSSKVIGPIAGGNNHADLDPATDATVNSNDSNVDEMSYSGHRVDAVKKWRSVKLSEFTKSTLEIVKAEKTMDNIYNFLTDTPGWREDKSLAAAWDDFQKFLDNADAKANTQPVAAEEVDEFALLTARTSGTKRKSVSQGDYDKARLSIIKALDWKVQATQDMIVKSAPVGLRQIEIINRLKADSQKLADAIKQM